MTTLIKWLVPPIFVFVIIVAIVFNAAVQNAAVRSTAELDLLAESISIGIVRANVEDGKDDFQYFDKEELVANLVTNVASVQKNHQYDIELNYVFLDVNGDITEIEKEIRGLQFQVLLRDQNGKVKGTSEKRLALNYPTE